MEDKRHTSLQYEKDLQDVKESLLYMGAMTEKSIERGVNSLLERNSELARQVMCDDDLIDSLDVEIEEKCIRLLALRQPAARDLRFITTAIKINGHLERIGDMAAKIVWLIEHPDQRRDLGLKLRAKIEVHYTWEENTRLVIEAVERAKADRQRK